MALPTPATVPAPPVRTPVDACAHCTVHVIDAMAKLSNYELLPQWGLCAHAGACVGERLPLPSGWMLLLLLCFSSCTRLNQTPLYLLFAVLVGAPQQHWFGPAGDPRSGGIHTVEAIQQVWYAPADPINTHTHTHTPPPP